MMAPRYQEIPAPRIPVARSADGSVSVKVIAGEALGRRAVIDTRMPIQYLGVELSARADTRARAARVAPNRDKAPG